MPENALAKALQTKHGVYCRINGPGCQLTEEIINAADPVAALQAKGWDGVMVDGHLEWACPTCAYNARANAN